MMKVNNNVRLHNIKGIDMLMNFDNQAVIGLDESGKKVWNEIYEKGWSAVDYEKNKELMDSMVELEFVTEDYTECKAEDKIDAAYVHLLNRCNLHCIGCYSMNSDRNREEDLSTDKWKLALKRLRNMGVGELVISGGEPLLREDIVDLMRYAKKDLNMESITLITNGTVSFDFSRLCGLIDLLAISIDGYNVENPTFLRDKGIFEKVVSSIERAQKSGLEVCMIPTVHKKNCEHLRDYSMLADELGVSINFSILSVPCNSVFKDFIPDNRSLDTMAQTMFELNASVDDIASAGDGICAQCGCGLGKRMISVDSKGNIYPCHILHYPNLKLGSIFEEKYGQDSFDNSVISECENATVDSIEGCKECEYKYICGGGCRGRAYFYSKNLKAKDPYCELFRKFHQIEVETIKNAMVKEGKYSA